MSDEHKHDPRYPLARMLDGVGDPKKTDEIVSKGQALLARLEHKEPPKPQEKKAEAGNSMQEQQGRTHPQTQFTGLTEKSMADAMAQIDELLPQAAARRPSQTAELREHFSPASSGVAVARTPTLFEQLVRCK